MVKVKAEALARILELCRSAYPYEVNGLLLGKAVVDDFVLMPSEYGPFSVVTRMHDVPIYPSASGTFHSHPSPDNRPSAADRRFFSKAWKNHLIVGYPYTPRTVAAYDSAGKAQPFEVI